MILTGEKIRNEIEKGNIIISPFDTKNLNPNSYNYRIGNSIKVYAGLENGKPNFKETTLNEAGFILEPGQMYLANTFELIGSKKYAMSLIGKSSIGRLGLFLQISANLGHTCSEHQWTLELVASKRIRIYKNMTIGQVSFWNNEGDLMQYTGFFGYKNNIQESNI